MIERKTIEVLTFTVIVELRDTTPKGFADIACGGCYDEPDEQCRFKIWFSTKFGTPGLKIIAHECWHLYMTVLKHIDKHDHTFEELNTEIYAYNFHKMFDDVLDCLFNMKEYQKLDN